ncbi:hypothetical protein CDO73_01120 [Saccharibacillus sp. O23]|uniref:hypothetical protein n=1 Tax=Saccharibacillus sp. O23 TaxID=2009338 RepID=UPI000B4E6F41|nr:hypothetical protein [Saccharibacillus sp. O23]OWR33136.1 hypothetical protein CDO73_01120 [Saccharibacillus sp. O23]
MIESGSLSNFAVLAGHDGERIHEYEQKKKPISRAGSVGFLGIRDLIGRSLPTAGNPLALLIRRANG